jgi:hypothetical protein
MKFGFDKYVEISNYPQPYPLPNAMVGAETLPREYNELSTYNLYSFLFKKELNYKEHNFGHNTVDALLEGKEPFIYPILLKDKNTFQQISDETYFKLSDKVVNAVKSNQAKILLSYVFEGDFYYREDIEAINKFVEKYGFNKKDVLVLTNNLKWKNTEPHSALFTLKLCNYFLLNPWFIKQDLLDQNNDLELRKYLNEKLDYIRTYPKPKRFLSLNRRPRAHRIALFTEIAKDKELINTTVISMGNRDLDLNPDQDPKGWKKVYDAYIPDSYKYGKQEGLDFLEHYDNSEDYFADANLDFNLAFNLNENLHVNTFVNVLTETLYENETIFLTEKIYKPIFACQPFIVFGNPGTLSELRELGFKTFGDFWDESYDDELCFHVRLEKIISIMKDLTKKTNKELLEITQQLIPILEHNFHHMIESSRGEVFTLKKILNEQFS